jgi:hypothetical protein
LPRGCAQHWQRRDRASGGKRLAADWPQSTDKETSMTLQAFSGSPFAPAREGRERSFWRQLLGAIMEGRQRKADECIKDYLRHHRGEHPDAFRGELERRHLGQ